jgi:hypothetical protein
MSVALLAGILILVEGEAFFESRSEGGGVVLWGMLACVFIGVFLGDYLWGKAFVKSGYLSPAAAIRIRTNRAPTARGERAHRRLSLSLSVLIPLGIAGVGAYAGQYWLIPFMLILGLWLFVSLRAGWQQADDLMAGKAPYPEDEVRRVLHDIDPPSRDGADDLMAGKLPSPQLESDFFGDSLATEKRGRTKFCLILDWLSIIIFPACGALTMAAISSTLLRHIPPEQQPLEPLGIVFGVLAIVVGADIGTRCWTYHAVRTGVLAEDTADRMIYSRKLPKALMNIEWSNGRIALMGGYIGVLAAWIPWSELPVVWLWLLAGFVGLFLASTIYTLLRKFRAR